MIRGLVEMLSDSGATAVPDPSTDATEVIKSQLVEDTGAHLLDSGGAYGRHHEENRDNPPWEQPEWNVYDSFVSRNVYHYMNDRLDRDRSCVALEAALYAFGHTDDEKREPWLRTTGRFAESVLDGELHRPALQTLGLSDKVIEDVLGIQRDHQPVRGAVPMTVNTYNGEFGELSQVLQGVNFGGPYAEYVALQVHGGADVRGGYTAPRVYKTWDGWIPGELSYYCPRCDWHEAESCLARGDESGLLYQSTIDPHELYERLREETPDDIPDEDVQDAADEAVEEAYDRDQSGAVFHVEDGCGGVVLF
jgi:hypothetical protein